MTPLLAACLPLVVAVLASCGLADETPHWIGDGVHEVGGYVLLAESDCGWPLIDAECQLAVPIAIEALNENDRDQIAAAARAAPPSAFADGKGGTTLMTTSGWVRLEGIIFRFADGQARVVAVFCEPVGTDLGHAPQCWPASADKDLPRAGDMPSLP